MALKKLAQQMLKEKAALLEGCNPSKIKSVTEDSKGAIVVYKTSCSPSVRRIPLEYWTGEKIDA
jgi:hypothetical protein